MLPGSEVALVDSHDALLLDLDGVCYVGDRPIDAAVETLSAVRRLGHSLRFITNNASRTTAEVAGRLRAMGIEAAFDEIVTSAECGAQLLAAELPAGAPVLVVGGPGVEAALEGAGLRPVHRADDQPAAVLQGWHPDVDWRMLAEATVAVRAGARYVATNLDRTIPAERGALPGNGSLVAVVSGVTSVTPRTVGKPEPAMYDAARAGTRRPLAVGDRLDTDIAGAARAGISSLLVLSGVTGPADLLSAPPDQRPTHVAPDLAGACREHPPVSPDGDGWRCGRAVARWTGSSVDVSGDYGTDGCDRLRAAAAAAWAAVDAGGRFDASGAVGLDLTSSAEG
jgi:HAD superfamily hydrolase (TIGR01450 family)